MCDSSLSPDKIIYDKKEWDKFDKSNVCNIAAQNGWLDLLQWARGKDYNWDSFTCAYAAGGGHLEILKWARQNGCECDDDMCFYAFENGQHEILKWIKDNCCVCGGKYHKG